MDYSSLISISNLFQAWGEFRKGKSNKPDVQIFERHLEDNLFSLHQKLKNRTYQHGRYSEFYVNDPKRRHIHKAEVADRTVHHLLYKYLYDIFDKTFIYDSYSCRLNKGTHKAVKRLEKFTRIVSKNYTEDCWALKLDIRQFFASIDHEILMSLIKKRVDDKDILWLIKEVIDSYSLSIEKNKRSYSSSDSEKSKPNSSHYVRTIEEPVILDKSRTIRDADNRQKGIPLGNLTSQIFANIYLNELDQFIKQKLMVRYYLRYADDFIILCKTPTLINRLIDRLDFFLSCNLKLELHPKKIVIRKHSWGIDFCGYLVLPHYVLPRTKTKKRILKKVTSKPVSDQSLQSYLGYLSHAASYRNSQNLKNAFYLSSLQKTFIVRA